MTSIDTSRYVAVPKLPTVADMCAAIRDGDTLEAIAARHGATSLSWIRTRIRDAGYNPATGQPSGHHLDDVTARAAVFERPAWMDDALCAQTDPEAFFPDKGESPRTGKATCARCPVRAECLDFALDNNEQFGIWGGLTTQQRRRLTPTPPPEQEAAS